MSLNPSDMTPEDHIQAGDQLLRFAHLKDGLPVERIADLRLRQAALAEAHYAAATAKLALVTFERGPKPVEMVFDRPVDTRPTA